ncbi:uncharacterized protein DS421_19g650880 [Arachis hypogaea]|uniref:Replication factor A C-terminal domain-containing protein n=1 Tax=Arachis hypogaea TaxID=3818 RepID=A0A6B9V8I7_ARAHY|nr:uncharacterized protein DS421_19g650880 [Arachis hypogaea]
MERSKTDWMKIAGKQRFRGTKASPFAYLKFSPMNYITCFIPTISVGFDPYSHKDDHSLLQANNLRGIDPYSRKVYYLDNPVHLLEDPAWIAASIVAINVTKDDWFYKSCKKCPKKVETPIGNRYECGKCGHTHGSAALRFKVEVMVFYGTGSIRLLLWDKETSMLLKCFICLQVIVGDEYPKTLDNMMDKRVLFKINIKEANINQFDHVYMVMKICDDEDIIDKNLPKELSTNLPSNVSEDGCNNYLEILENVANLKTDCDTESSMDVVEECISSLKYNTPPKKITNGLKNSPLSLNEDEEEGQLSTNRFSRKMGKRQKCVNFDADMNIDGPCIGHVVASGNAKFKKGDFVVGVFTWAEYSVVKKGSIMKKLDPF